MAKIDRVEDLPEWFKLEKYQECKSFGAVEWLEQLERRRDILKTHPMYMEYPEREDYEQWENFCLEFWKLTTWDLSREVRDAPLYSPSEGKIREWVLDPYARPVRAIYPYDFIEQSSRDLEAERKGKAPAGMSVRWDSMNPSNITNITFLRQSHIPLSLNYYNGAPEVPLIQVDLGVSDAALKEAFSDWLKEARANQKPEGTKRSKPFYERWARYGMLPYLDLKTWALETDTHIPDRVMSAAVSHYDAGEANLRKTVAPLADSLMRSLKELEILAAAEVTAAGETPETFKV